MIKSLLPSRSRVVEPIFRILPEVILYKTKNIQNANSYMFKTRHLFLLKKMHHTLQNVILHPPQNLRRDLSQSTTSTNNLELQERKVISLGSFPKYEYNDIKYVSYNSQIASETVGQN
jgi:hypothetical protein